MPGYWRATAQKHDVPYANPARAVAAQTSGMAADLQLLRDTIDTFDAACDIAGRYPKTFLSHVKRLTHNCTPIITIAATRARHALNGESVMKFLATLILAVTVASTAAQTFTTGRDSVATDDNIVLAQRFCPNKRC